MAETLQEVLLEHHLVTQDELKEAIRKDKTDLTRGLADVLVDSGFVEEHDLVAAFMESLGVEEIDLTDIEIADDVLNAIPKKLIHQFRILPLEVCDTHITIAMFDPTRLQALDTISRTTGKELKVLVALRSDLLEAICLHYGKNPAAADDLMEEIHPIEDTTLSELTPSEEDDTVHVDVAGTEAEPVVRIVRRILREAFEMNASDIHIEPFKKFISLRYRIDGDLEDLKRPPKIYQENIVARLKILSGCRIDEHRIPQDGRISVIFEGRKIDLRVAFLPCRHGEKVVLRILDQTGLTLEFEKLGFEEQPMRDFQMALTRPNGMVLVTGPTGSGKTTTLYSALHQLNTRKVNIVTVEDPIEYELVGINQVHVNPKVGLTFAAALRQILRQDPDIVMVGEMRDSETADVGVKAALTGHLVLTTLHTNDAAGVFPRLIDMDVEPFLVQSSVLLASAQRLLKRICPDCKVEDEPSEDVLERSQIRLQDYDGVPQLFRGTGCRNCRETGFKGRLAVIEVMMNNPEISVLASRHAAADEIKKAAMAAGMRTLRQNALAKAVKGLTTLGEAMARTTPD